MQADPRYGKMCRALSVVSATILGISEVWQQPTGRDEDVGCAYEGQKAGDVFCVL